MRADGSWKPLSPGLPCFRWAEAAGNSNHLLCISTGHSDYSCRPSGGLSRLTVRGLHERRTTSPVLFVWSCNLRGGLPSDDLRQFRLDRRRHLLLIDSCQPVSWDVLGSGYYSVAKGQAAGPALLLSHLEAGWTLAGDIQASGVSLRRKED